MSPEETEIRKAFITYYGWTCSGCPKYKTEEIAAKVASAKWGREAYPCPHDDHWHIFRAMSKVEIEIFSDPELRPEKSRDETLEEMHERGQSEITCSHGERHPNPDYLVWMRIQRMPPEDIVKERNHACDGCCKISSYIA